MALCDHTTVDFSSFPKLRRSSPQDLDQAPAIAKVCLLLHSFVLDMGPDFWNILRWSYDILGFFILYALILRQIYDNANFRKILSQYCEQLCEHSIYCKY